jgi:hypothetical protein
MRKGRLRFSGTGSISVKLTDEQVISIRQQHASGATTKRQLAAEFGVSRGNIAMIVNRHTWKQLA